MSQFTVRSSALLVVIVCAARLPAGELQRARALVDEAIHLLNANPPKPAYGSDLWSDIGLMQQKTGNHDGAKASFTRAWRAAAADVSGGSIWSSFIQPAEMQARAGQIPEAVAQAQRIASVDERAAVLRSIAAIQAGGGNLAGAVETANLIPKTNMQARASALAMIGAVFADEQNVKAVLAVSELIPADFARAETLIEKADSKIALNPVEHSIVECAQAKCGVLFFAAWVSAKAGQFDAAITTARQIALKDQREGAFAFVASAAADAGRLDVAHKCRKQLRGQYPKDRVNVRIAAALVRQGRLKDASNLADQIDDPKRKADAFFEIAAAYAAQGDERSVSAVFSKITPLFGKDSYFLAEGMKRIVAGFLKGGHIAEAVSFSDGIKDPDAASEALRDIALAAARLRRKDEARWLFDESLRAAERIKRDFRKAQRLRELAAAQGEVGDRTSASATLALAIIAAQKEGVRSKSDVETFSELAMTQTAIGDPKGAIKTLSLPVSILAGRTGDDAGPLLQAATRAQAWLGDVDESVGAARNQKLPIVRAHMLVGVASGILARWAPKPIPQKHTPL